VTASVIEIVEVFEQLNESNRFAVLVYARMKVALQVAALCKPYDRIKKIQAIPKALEAHWVGDGGAG
jgi:hypothetical protein